MDCAYAVSFYRANVRRESLEDMRESTSQLVPKDWRLGAILPAADAVNGTVASTGWPHSLHGDEPRRGEFMRSIYPPLWSATRVALAHFSAAGLLLHVSGATMPMQSHRSP
jgi:hypothetical protein